MANRITEIKEQLQKSLNDSTKPWTPIFKSLEAKTGVNRLYIFVGVVATVCLWLIFGFAGQLLCNSIGFLYPAYVSIHAIESRNKEDDTKWLTYWVVFSLFSIIEYFVDFIVSWFPLYWLVKCVFCIWLMIPTELNGSVIIYARIIKPYFVKHHGSIDRNIDKIKTTAGKFLDKDD